MPRNIGPTPSPSQQRSRRRCPPGRRALPAHHCAPLYSTSLHPQPESRRKRADLRGKTARQKGWCGVEGRNDLPRPSAFRQRSTECLGRHLGSSERSGSARSALEHRRRRPGGGKWREPRRRAGRPGECLATESKRVDPNVQSGASLRAARSRPARIGSPPQRLGNASINRRPARVSARCRTTWAAGPSGCTPQIRGQLQVAGRFHPVTAPGALQPDRLGQQRQPDLPVGPVHRHRAGDDAPGPPKDPLVAVQQVDRGQPVGAPGPAGSAGDQRARSAAARHR